MSFLGLPRTHSPAPNRRRALFANLRTRPPSPHPRVVPTRAGELRLSSGYIHTKGVTHEEEGKLVLFTTKDVLDAIGRLGGKASRRRIRTHLREQGFEVVDDELDFVMYQLLVSGQIRQMVGQEAMLEDVYELQRS